VQNLGKTVFAPDRDFILLRFKKQNMMTNMNTTAVLYWARGDIPDALDVVEAFLDSYDKHPAGVQHSLVLLLTGWHGNPEMPCALMRAWRSGARLLELPTQSDSYSLLEQAIPRLSEELLCLFMPGDTIMGDDWLMFLTASLNSDNIEAVGTAASWLTDRPTLRDLLFIVLSGEWGIKGACRKWVVSRLACTSGGNAQLKLSGLCLRRKTIQTFLEEHPDSRSHLKLCGIQRDLLSMGSVLKTQKKQLLIVAKDGSTFRLNGVAPDGETELPTKEKRLVRGCASPMLRTHEPPYETHLWGHTRKAMNDTKIRTLIKPYLKAKIKQKFPRLIRGLKAMRQGDPIDHSNELQMERLKNSGNFPVTISPARLDFVYKHPRTTKNGMPDRQLPINLLTPPFLVPLWVKIEESFQKTPKVNVVLPSSSIKATSGGPNTIYTLIAELLRQHIPVRLLSITAPPDEDDTYIKQHIAQIGRLKHGEEDSLEVLNACTNTGPLALGVQDLFVATAWWTAQAIKEILPQFSTQQFIYIIQDFEPNLHAPSSNYVLALETYSMDIMPIFNTCLLRDHFLKDKVGIFKDWAGSKPPLHFEPAVDRKAFFPERGVKNRKKRLLFYARPDAPRNLLELGVAALMRCLEQGGCDPDEWEFYSISSGTGIACRPVLLVPPATTLDFFPLPTYELWAQEMRKTDVVLSLIWSPHPSYPPIEGAACGAWVVTNTCGVKSSERLSAISPQILSGPPTVDGIADALRQAFTYVSEGQRPAVELNYPESWREAWQPVLPELLSYLADKGVLPTAYQKS
jgi:hypothetical protein